MKKRKTFFYFVILILLLMGTSQALLPRSPGALPPAKDRTKSLAGIANEAPHTIDVLVLGDSESYTSFSPMDFWQETGATSYVCGQSGQHISETYYMLKQALRTQSPKLVLLETDTLFRYGGLAKETKVALAEIASYHFPVFRYHNRWKQAIDPPGKPDPKWYQGFLIRPQQAPYQGGPYMNKTTDTERLPRFVRFYMNRIQRLCRRHHIPLMLYSAPSPLNYSYPRHNALQSYANEHKLRYLDLNLSTEAIGIDWHADSLDQGDHLNYKGARKVTGYLSRFLKKHLILPDHRGDEGYQKWDRMLSDYLEDLDRLSSQKARSKA